jgi:GT2 family glycosyltransferase
MKTSIIIPVWNGASVITQCLEALFTHCNLSQHEIICVDNASTDDSASLVAQSFAQSHSQVDVVTRLISLPINLGFAGGVNAGIEASAGDVFTLLNQDCLVQPGWFEAMTSALHDYPDFGVLGCTILNPDDSINHTGAVLIKPAATGVHLTDWNTDTVREIDFSTGAALAIRRSTWQLVGRFDEGFYPAYYEDVDYCYRARQAGVKIGCVMPAKVKHLFSNQSWQKTPLRHTASHHSARYRFISKYYSSEELSQFFITENQATSETPYLDQAAGRALAARHILRSLPDIIERRRIDLGDSLTIHHQAQLRIGFASLYQQAFRSAEQLLANQPGLDIAETKTTRRMETQLTSTEPSFEVLPEPPFQPVIPQQPATPEELPIWVNLAEQMDTLRRQEYALFSELLSYSPGEQIRPNWLKILYQRLIARPLRRLSGHDERILAEIEQGQRKYIALLEGQFEIARQQAGEEKQYLQKQNDLLESKIGNLQAQMAELGEQKQQTDQQTQEMIGALQATLSKINQRLALLEILTEHDILT